VQTEGSVASCCVDWVLQCLQLHIPPATLFGTNVLLADFVWTVCHCLLNCSHCVSNSVVWPSAECSLRSAWRIFDDFYMFRRQPKGLFLISYNFNRNVADPQNSESRLHHPTPLLKIYLNIIVPSAVQTPYAIPLRFILILSSHLEYLPPWDGGSDCTWPMTSRRATTSDTCKVSHDLLGRYSRPSGYYMYR